MQKTSFKHIILFILFTGLVFAGGNFFEPKPYVREHSDIELLNFFEDVAARDIDDLMQESALMPEQIFRNRTDLDVKFTFCNFNKLKHALKEGYIDTSLANELFDFPNIDTMHVENGKIAINLYSFKGYKEFAVSMGKEGYTWEDDVYFFKSRRMIAKHHIRHRYGLMMDHFKNVNGKTIIFYKENFASGSGIWWYNYFFYQYNRNQLIPVLNLLQETNLQFMWGNVVKTFRSGIISTEPLRLEMNYCINFSIPFPIASLACDADTISILWDENKQQLIPDYSHSPLNKAKVLSYYLGNNDLLLIRAYYNEIKLSLQNAETREAVLNFLDAVKK